MQNVTFPTRATRPVHLVIHNLALLIALCGDTRWCTWLRHCATSRKVAGSIPDGVTGIFHSGRIMAEYQEYFLGIKTAGA